MDTNRILADLRAERNRIDRAISAIEELNGRAIALTRTVRSASAAPLSADMQPVARRRISAAGRKRISEAAKKMWSERKKANGPYRRRPMSAATKRKLSLAAKARWAQQKGKD
jgi:hypothetical protein